jgi:membrane protein
MSASELADPHRVAGNHCRGVVTVLLIGGHTMARMAPTRRRGGEAPEPEPGCPEPRTPTGLTAASWRGVLRRSVTKYRGDNLSDWAAALTYRSTLTIAPAALLLVSVLGFLSTSAADELLRSVQELAPGGAKTVLEQILNNVSRPRTAGVGAIVGVVIAWWSTSSYIAAFTRASNAIYDIGEGRPAYKTVAMRLVLTLALLVLAVVATAIAVLSGPVAERVGHALGLGDTAITVWNVAKWPLLIIIVSTMISLLYYAAPNVKQPGLSWIGPGGVLAVLLWVIVSALFGLYVANFSSYNKTYGTLAGVIIFLIWLWLTNTAILLGAEFNAELQHARAMEQGAHEDDRPFVEPRDTRKLSAKQQRGARALGRKPGIRATPRSGHTTGEPS